MTTLQPAGPIAVAANGRKFSCYAVGVDVFIVDGAERILLLRHPSLDAYEVVNGGVEAGETVWEAAAREVAEEAGPIEVRLLGVFDARTVTYQGLPLIAVDFVAELVGGEVVPGDDMAGSEVRWSALDELSAGAVPLHIPSEPSAFERAIAQFRMLRG